MKRALVNALPFTVTLLLRVCLFKYGYLLLIHSDPCTALLAAARGDRDNNSS